MGDALAVAALNKKKINQKDFKKFHPSGNLGAQLKTVEDLMLSKEKIPFINENSKMENALKIITQKKLGTLIVINNKKLTTGIVTDGQIRRISLKKNNLHQLKVKEVMTKNPITVDKEMLAFKALSLMNENKITILCVSKAGKKNRTMGIIHIHNILENGIQ